MLPGLASWVERFALAGDEGEYALVVAANGLAAVKLLADQRPVIRQRVQVDQSVLVPSKARTALQPLVPEPANSS